MNECIAANPLQSYSACVATKGGRRRREGGAPRAAALLPRAVAATAHCRGLPHAEEAAVRLRVLPRASASRRPTRAAACAKRITVTATSPLREAIAKRVADHHQPPRYARITINH